MECTPFEVYDKDFDRKRPDLNFCRCPICKAFLPQDFPEDKPFNCKRCGAELMTFPEYDEVDGSVIPWAGKICPISTEKQKERIP